ncbi:MAG: hypothetical protein QM708_08135 [Propioniciclava sp.]|uniref:SCO7613 C-terminal domain-containing membrane protein n=1 Tax=Propioniciclava sp. TaxID=2038686 RepID=UPI0039E4F4AF
MSVLDEAIAELRRWHHCPACGRPLRRDACDGCGLPLHGEDAVLLRRQSEAAAQALELRQRTLSRMAARTDAPARPEEPGLAAKLVSQPAGGPTPAGSPTPADTVLPPAAMATTPAPGPAAVVRAETRAGVNPVAIFSAVGVGALVAAALVLAFLVPADPGLVRIILLAVTVTSAAATLVMRRRRPVSAASIATGTALLALLVTSLFVGWLAPETEMLAAALATGGLAAGLGTAGFALRLRPWVSAGILLAPIAAAPAALHFLRLGELWPTALSFVAGVALAAAGRRIARRWQDDRPGPLPFRVERAVVGTGAAFALLLAVAVTLALALDAAPGAPFSAGLALAAAGAAWLHGATSGSGWRRIAGMIAVLAPVFGVLGVDGHPLIAAASGSLGWLAMAGLSALPSGEDGRWSGLLKGGWASAMLLGLPAAGELLAGLGDREGLRDPGAIRVLMPAWNVPDAGYAATGLLLLAAVCAVAASLPPSRLNRPSAAMRAPDDLGTGEVSGWMAPWLALAGLAAFAVLPVMPLATSVWLLLALALVCGLVALWVGERAVSVRTAARIGGGLMILAAAAASWDSRPLTLAAGAAVVALVLGWTQLVPGPGRPALVGVGYGYALTLLGFALHWYPLGWAAGEWTPVAGLLAVAASLVSVGVLVATPVVPGGFAAATVYTVWGIGLIPWVLAIVTVLDERSWWAAAATVSMLAVEFAVTVRGRPQPLWLRVITAASLLPTAGIVLINAGAMLIRGSGSPILLPVIAALAVGTAIAASPAASRIERIDGRAARPVRIAFEAGALLTALASVVLAVILPAAGPDTSLVVCAILAAGGAVVATQPDRHPVWWLVALAASGVLWSALVLLEVGLVEAYTLPLGVAAVIVGGALARRRTRWWVLVAAGLQLALVPTWLLAVTGRDLLVRAAALTVVAALLAGSTWFARRRGERRALWALAGAVVVAGTAPLVLAVRSSGRVRPVDPGLEDLLLTMDADPLAGFSWVVATAAVSAALLGVAGQQVRWAWGDSERWNPVAASWRFAPALTVAASGLVLAVRPGAAVVWIMWLACLAFLAVAVASTLLRLRGRVILPPVWYCWLLALGVGIAGWSVRALRVEFHALPLGLTLLGCGVLAWRAARRGVAVDDRSWPIGRSDPAWVILPGVLATLGPSTLAIGTDPQTWRAILVLVMALAALLVGARMLWRPCLVAGIVDLAVAVGLVFIARRGAIDAVPWLIALVSAGGVLLGLAIYSERRQHAAQERG